MCRAEMGRAPRRERFLLLPCGEKKGEDLTKKLAGGLFQPGLSVFSSFHRESLLALLDPFLPGFVLSIITDGVAQPEHAVDILPFPVHA